MTPFGVRQFSRLFAGALTVNIFSFLIITMGNVLSGNFLGEEALSGVALASPFLTFGNFLNSLVGCGTGIVYSLRRGRLDRDGAQSAFVQGLWTALASGILFGLAVYLFRDAYFGMVGPSPASVVHACEFWRYFPFALAVIPMSAVLVNCCYCDGDSGLAVAAYVVQYVFASAVSWLLLRCGYGAASCSLGILVGYVSCCLVLALHFFRKTNTFTFAWRFRMADSFAIMKSSAGDALGFFGDALAYVVLGVVITRAYGQDALVYFPLFVFVTELLSYATGFASAMQPIVGVYFGEGNHRSVRVVARSVFLRLAVFSVLVAAVILVFPGLVVWAVGIDDPSLVENGLAVVRWSALIILPLTVMNVLNNYFQFIEREVVAVWMTVFYWFVAPIGMVLLFSFADVSWFWCWASVARWGGIALFALFLLLRYGRNGFPFLLDPRRESKITVYDLRLREMDIALAAEEVSMKMKAAGIAHDRAMRARLLVEEVLMVVKDRNGGRTIYAEVTLDLNDGVKLTLRDDGEIFDITDADARVNGLRTYLVASMMQRQSDKTNILTTGFNRNVFRL